MLLTGPALLWLLSLAWAGSMGRPVRYARMGVLVFSGSRELLPVA